VEPALLKPVAGMLSFQWQSSTHISIILVQLHERRSLSHYLIKSYGYGFRTFAVDQKCSVTSRSGHFRSNFLNSESKAKKEKRTQIMITELTEGIYATAHCDATISVTCHASFTIFNRNQHFLRAVMRYRLILFQL